MSSIRARLTVVLKAEEVVVAESADADLWQRVLFAINTGESFESELVRGVNSAVTPPLRDELGQPPITTGRQTADSPIDNLARKLGVTPEQVEGACAPSISDPFMHLDMHAWSAVKSQLPERGAKALSPIAVAGTLLALWFKEASIGTATQSHAHKVLATISLQDKNPTRGIRSATWLQSRPGGQIVLNPAAIQKAILLARCFCVQDWKAWNTAEE